MKAPQFVEDWLSPEGQLAYARHRRHSIVAVGLLAAWVLIQYMAVILL